MVKVCRIEDIPNGTARGFVVDNFPILIVKNGGKIFVYEDRCSHQDMRISENYEIDESKDTITCMWHGAKFYIPTGEVRSMPAPAPIQKLNFKIDDEGWIWVEI